MNAAAATSHQYLRRPAKQRPDDQRRSHGEQRRRSPSLWLDPATTAPAVGSTIRNASRASRPGSTRTEAGCIRPAAQAPRRSAATDSTKTAQSRPRTSVAQPDGAAAHEQQHQEQRAGRRGGDGAHGAEAGDIGWLCPRWPLRRLRRNSRKHLVLEVSQRDRRMQSQALEASVDQACVSRLPLDGRTCAAAGAELPDPRCPGSDDADAAVGRLGGDLRTSSVQSAGDAAANEETPELPPPSTRQIELRRPRTRHR